MQIKIVQVEIEEAIRNHIERQIKVRDGMQINIDLSATRGPEGFIATIDIVPAEAPKAEGVQHVASTNDTAGTAPTAGEQAKTDEVAVSVAPRRGRPPATPKPDPVVAAKPEPEVVAEETVDAVSGDDQGSQTAQEAEPAVEGAAAASTAKSLFGGLQRPNNG